LILLTEKKILGERKSLSFEGNAKVYPFDKNVKIKTTILIY